MSPVFEVKKKQPEAKGVSPMKKLTLLGILILVLLASSVHIGRNQASAETPSTVPPGVRSGRTCEFYFVGVVGGKWVTFNILDVREPWVGVKGVDTTAHNTFGLNVGGTGWLNLQQAWMITGCKDN
jgi:hypothetical protein